MPNNKSKNKGASRRVQVGKSAERSEPEKKSGKPVGEGAISRTATVKTASSDTPDRSPRDWRSTTLENVRRMIFEADPDIVEERKWVKATNPLGVPVWSHAGIVCTGETYKQVVKLTFARGASLKDPKGLFNSSLEGNTRRAIDIREGDSVDEKAFKTLVRAAVAENLRISAGKS
jgi:hypothetical protein